MKDSFGREITYARVSVTDLCNLRCRYCMDERGVEKKDHSDILSIEQLSFICSALADAGVTKLRLTGGEPLVRKGFITLAENAGKMSFKDVGITTNGVYLAKYADKLRNAGITLINVSIDSLKHERYAEITRGGILDDALNGVCAVKEACFAKVKINAVLQRGVNDDEISDFATFGREMGVPVRFIELMPFNVTLCYAKEKFISASEIIKRYKLAPGREHGGNCAFYDFPDGRSVGFISPVSGKFCAECNRVRITADGKLLNCLHENKEYDLKPYLDNKERLIGYISECVKRKPAEHHMDGGCYRAREMNRIGG